MKGRLDSLSFVSAIVASGLAKGTRFLDVAINGQALSQIAQFAYARRDLASPAASEVGVFDWPTKDVRTAARQLLLREPSQLGERVHLYRCPCGDWECGGTSVRVTAYEDVYLWEDFGTPADVDRKLIRPFVFERLAYEAALASYA